MPDEEPFDKAMRKATEKEWEASKRKPYQMTSAQRAAIHRAVASGLSPADGTKTTGESDEGFTSPSATGADRDSPEAKTIPLFRRFLDWRLALAAAAVLIAAVWIASVVVPRPVQLAMTLPTLKGVPPPDPGVWVNESVNVSINWKKKSIQVPLRAGGVLSGTFRKTEANPAAPLAPAQMFDVSLNGHLTTGQKIVGNGQLIVMPKDSGQDFSRLSAKAIQWAKLDLKLQANGQTDLVYRVFGKP